jgi:hypothetical protein
MKNGLSVAMKWETKTSHGLWCEKQPRTKEEIQRLIVAELRTFANCESALGIVVIPIDVDADAATWTVSRFHCGGSDGYACDRALQCIVPHFQQLYDLVQKH